MKVSNAKNIKHSDAWAQYARTSYLGIVCQNKLTVDQEANHPLCDFWMADPLQDTGFTGLFLYSSPFFLI